MKNIKSKIYIAIFLLTVLLVWSAIYAIPTPAEIQLSDSSVQDLSGHDFGDTVYRSFSCWESWPEVYYTPANFRDGLVTEPGRPRKEMDYSVTRYATHRVQFILPPGKTYGLILLSADYSMRIFIDGIDIDSVGNPGETRETTTPRTLKKTYYFAAPQSGEVEVILHMANFVHREGAYPPQFFIGTAESITRKYNADQFKFDSLFFCLLTVSLYHFGLFLMNPKRKTALLFSVSCLLMAFLDYKIFLNFFSNYNWFAAMRFEYINHYLIFAAITLFLESMYPNLLHRICTRVFYAVTGLYIIITLIFDPKIFTVMLYGFSAFSISLAGYVMIRLMMNLKNRTAQNILIFIGLLPVALFGMFDILNMLEFFNIPHIFMWQFLSPIGMVFMVFCYTLAVALDYADTERRYAIALLEIAEIKTRLAEAAESKTTQDISTLGLSGRELEVAYLLIGGKNRDEIGALLGIAIGTVNTYCTRIYKKTGCASKEVLALTFGKE